jgi:hypothetical protein
MSNFSYCASRTPSAMFSKSQKSAMLAVSLGAAMKCFQLEENADTASPKPCQRGMRRHDAG